MAAHTKQGSVQKGNNTIVLYSKVGTHSILLLTDRGFSLLVTMSLTVFHREDKV